LIDLCSLYIRENIQSQRAKKILLGGGLAFGLILPAYWAITFLKKNNLPMHIIIPKASFYYILTIFLLRIISQKTSKVIQIPMHFGLFRHVDIFQLVTPLFPFLYYLRTSNSPLTGTLYIINNLAYCFLFMTFAIAILCKGKQTDLKINSLS